MDASKEDGAALAPAPAANLVELQKEYRFKEIEGELLRRETEEKEEGLRNTNAVGNGFRKMKTEDRGIENPEEREEKVD